MLPPSANRLPELETAPAMPSPPLPVASRAPALTKMLAPVSISSALTPVAMIVPSLTRFSTPWPSWPAPEMVLSILVRVTSEAVPAMTLALLSDIMI